LPPLLNTHGRVNKTLILIHGLFLYVLSLTLINKPEPAWILDSSWSHLWYPLCWYVQLSH
jgi:hypothetical protein